MSAAALALAAALAWAQDDGLSALKKDLSAFRPKGAPARSGALCDAEPVIDSHARGAWFRRVDSVGEGWTGISGEGTLPYPAFDKSRFYVPAPGEPDFWEGPLDRPSVYLGARSKDGNVEAGLTWDRVFDAAGKPTGEFAFRPFWRDSSSARKGWGNPKKGEDRYLQPGEKFTMTLRVRADGSARFDLRSGRGWHLTQVLGAGTLVSREALVFRRVNAIDQFRSDASGRKGNEGRPALGTAAAAKQGAWWKVSLIDAKEKRRPLAGAFCREAAGPDTASRYSEIIAIQALNPEGGERLDIVPPAR